MDANFRRHARKAGVEIVVDNRQQSVDGLPIERASPAAVPRRRLRPVRRHRPPTDGS